MGANIAFLPLQELETEPLSEIPVPVEDSDINDNWWEESRPRAVEHGVKLEAHTWRGRVLAVRFEGTPWGWEVASIEADIGPELSALEDRRLRRHFQSVADRMGEAL